MTSATLRTTIIANPLASDQEAAAFLAADEHWDALAHYWRKLLPSNVYKVLEALLEHTRFNAKSWTSGTPPVPSHERLATLSGISIRTVCRILARDAQGHYTYSYQRCIYHRATDASRAAYEDAHARQAQDNPQATPWPPCTWQVGELVAVKRDLATRLYLEGCYELGDLIAMFIVDVERRGRYDTQQRRWLRTSNAYHVTAIMPLPPTLEADIAYGTHLSMVRSRRADLTDESATIRNAASGAGSQHTPSCHVESYAKLSQEDPSATLINSHKVTSIVQKGVGPKTIRNDHPETKTTKTDHQNRRSNDEDEETTGTANKIAIDPVTPPPLRAAPPIVTVTSDREHFRRGQVDALVGRSVERNAQSLYDDAAPQVTRRLIVAALVAAETPLEQLDDAIALAHHRFNRVYGPGGKAINTTPIAAWIVVARSVIAKGRSHGHRYAQQDLKEISGAQVARDARAAASHTGNSNMAYIQTPSYYARLQTPAPSAATSPAIFAPGSLADAFAQADRRRAERDRAGQQ